jgi:hypothetical protein
VTERDSGGGLDDLFAMVAEPAEEPFEADEKPRSPVLWVTRNLLLVGVATVVTVAVLRSLRLGVSVPVVAAAFVALRLLLLAVAEVAPPPAPKRTAGPDTAASPHGADVLRSAVGQWEQRLEWSQSDPVAFARNVLPVLAELADERLRLRHGMTRASDPRRARELLGEPLWLALGDAGGRSPRARDLADYVAALERL